ncbi:MAG: hypothetical protein NC204_07010 [Candidatus Amulumruptor caecigallinarius]|nr:hypothetical protein [Candidatus Amulumruptor caecigallinarius]
MKLIKIFVSLALVALAVASCRPVRDVNPVQSVSRQEAVAVSYAPEGKITIRSWGVGPTRAAAIESAKINAVYDVLFKGIKTGAGAAEAMVREPMMKEVNAYERYAGYFQPFLSAGGEYGRYVWEADKQSKLLKGSGTSSDSYGVLVVVDINALRNQLVTDGVIAE